MRLAAVLFLITSMLAFGKDAEDFTDAELLSAGWSQAQIDDLRMKERESSTGIPNQSRRSYLKQASNNCGDETLQVLGEPLIAKDVASYWVACMKLNGFEDIEQLVPELEFVQLARNNDVHMPTRKPFIMLARERREYEYEYCISPILEHGVIEEYLLDRMEVCLKDFKWLDHQVQEVMSNARAIRDQ